MGTGKIGETNAWPAKLESLLTKHYQATEIKIQTDAQSERTIIKSLFNFYFSQNNSIDNLLKLYQKRHKIDLFMVFRNKWLFWI
ncbi:hypothetical protein [Spiroplasma endosymbiont of Polydrusus formosus]|uniref:hypothetical protein n=1 Tax=Spiroplasma endosymbiont of Polydrusus formosus TaxID=3139326 RepID=UPI0035B51439